MASYTAMARVPDDRVLPRGRFGRTTTASGSGSVLRESAAAASCHSSSPGRSRPRACEEHLTAARAAAGSADDADGSGRTSATRRPSSGPDDQAAGRVDPADLANMLARYSRDCFDELGADVVGAEDNVVAPALSASFIGSPPATPPSCSTPTSRRSSRATRPTTGPGGRRLAEFRPRWRANSVGNFRRVRGPEPPRAGLCADTFIHPSPLPANCYLYPAEVEHQGT